MNSNRFFHEPGPDARPKPEVAPPQNALTRRELLTQAAIVSGALAAPVHLFGQAEASASEEAVAMTGLLRGWRLKSVAPGAELTPNLMSRVWDQAREEKLFAL